MFPIALPQPVAIDLARTTPGWSQAAHSHPTHEINYVRRGRGWLHAGGREIPLARGAIYLFLPGEAHGGASSLDDPLQIMYLAIRFPGSAPVVRERTPLPFFLTGAAAAAVAPGLRALCEIIAASPWRTDARQPLPDAALPHMLAVLAAMVEPMRVFDATGTRQRGLAERALAELDRTPTRPPSLSAVAARLHV
nr:AraC family ligand binding domain-containing protein [Planctomycetota bacterium]